MEIYEGKCRERLAFLIARDLGKILLTGGTIGDDDDNDDRPLDERDEDVW